MSSLSDPKPGERLGFSYFYSGSSLPELPRPPGVPTVERCAGLDAASGTSDPSEAPGRAAGSWGGEAGERTG